MLDLKAIKARYEKTLVADATHTLVDSYEILVSSCLDVPVLVAEVQRLRAALRDLLDAVENENEPIQPVYKNRLRTDLEYAQRWPLGAAMVKAYDVFEGT